MMAPSPLALAWPPSSVYSASHLGPVNSNPRKAESPQQNDPSWNWWPMTTVIYNFSHFFFGVQCGKIPPKENIWPFLVLVDFFRHPKKKNTGFWIPPCWSPTLSSTPFQWPPHWASLFQNLETPVNQDGIRMWNNSWSSLQILGRIHFWDTCVIKGVKLYLKCISHKGCQHSYYISIFNIVDVLF